MAAPSDPTLVTLGGDARVLFVTWTADDSIEDYCEVALSANNGSSYGDSVIAPMGDRQFTFHQPTASSTYKARVRRVYGVDASAWVESTSLAVTTVAALITGVVPVEGDGGQPVYTTGGGSDVYLFVGENVDGQALCPNPDAMSDTLISLNTRTVSLVGAHSIGAATVTLDAATLTGLVQRGDVLMFPGDLTRYRIDEIPPAAVSPWPGYTLAIGNALTNVPIRPTLRLAQSDNAVVTVHSPIGFADVVPHVVGTDLAPKWRWANRNAWATSLALPYTPVPVLVWNQTGTGVSIATIATGSGNTTITFSGSHNMTVGWGRWVRFRNTGVANLDNTQQFIVATTSTAAVITGFVASTTSSTGIADFPLAEFYDESYRGHVDWVESGRQPSRYWGLERSFLSLAQDSRGPIGDDTRTPIVALKVVGGYPIASRLVGSATTAKRWTKQREVSTPTGANTGGSKFTDYRRQLRDLKTFLDRAGSASAPGPYTIRGIVVSSGYNEASSDIAQVRRQIAVISVAVVGAVATVTTAAHSLTDTAGKLYNLAIITGLGGTLGDAINGKHYPLSAASSTTFTILDFDATGLTGTVVSGTTFADVGSPMHFFAEMLDLHIDHLRETAIEELDSSQDLEDVPVALWEPNRDIYLRYYNSLGGGAAANALADIAYGNVVADMRAVASTKEKVRSFTLDDVAHKENTPFFTSELYFGHDGQIEIGERAWDAIQDAARGGVGGGGVKRPAVFGVIIGDSYVVGTNAFAIGQLANPEAVSPATTLSGGRGAPVTWAKVWNHATQAWETILVDPTLDLAYSGRTNCNTNPKFAIGLSPFAGVHLGLMRELRLGFPDHDIYLLPFGVNSSVAQSYVIPTGNALLAAIDGVTPGASTVTITLRTSGSGALRILRDAPINVVIEGVSGLTPSINGSHVATPVSVVTTPGSAGTQSFTIPVSGVTGTAVVTTAFASVPQAIWDPDGGDIFPELQAQIIAAIEAAQADDVLLDGRFGVIYCGTNDVALSFFGLGSTTGYTAALARMKDELRDLITNRAKPRHEVPIVCLEPIVHGRNVLPSAYYEAFQVACRAAVADDPRATTLNVDETTDRLEDNVTIAADQIHPDTIGLFNLGVRTARALATIADWDAPLDQAASGSGNSGVIEVLA